MRMSEEEEIGRILGKLGYYWKNFDLFRQAITHSSSVGGAITSNERLEWLGDSILDTVVAERLFERAPGARESFLSQTRADMVCEKRLSELAEEIGVGNILIVGRGAESVRYNRRALADCMEALVGAAFLDGGLPAARLVVEKMGVMADV